MLRTQNIKSMNYIHSLSILGHEPSSGYLKQSFQLSSIHGDHFVYVDCTLSVVTSHHFLSNCIQVGIASNEETPARHP